MPTPPDSTRRIGDLTVVEFQELADRTLKKVMLWTVLIYVGIPVLLFGCIGLAGFVLYSVGASQG